MQKHIKGSLQELGWLPGITFKRRMFKFHTHEERCQATCPRSKLTYFQRRKGLAVRLRLSKVLALLLYH